MAERSKGIVLRLSSEGAETVKRALRELGADGEAALKKIERAGKTVSPGLRAVDAAARDLRGTAEGLASRLGPVGSALMALGPGGIVAGAGIAGVGIAIAKAVGIARDAVRDFSELNKTIADIGVDSDVFQGLQFQAGLGGIDDPQFQDAMRTFAIRTTEAASGTGKLVTGLKLLNPELLQQLQSTGSVTERLRMSADALAKETDAAKRATLAKQLFGEANVRMAQLLNGGRDSLDRFVDSGREIGVVIDRDVLNRADAMGDKLDAASKIVDLNLKRAFIDLVPFISAAANGIAAIARLIAAIVESTRELKDQSTGALLQKQKFLDGVLAGGVNAPKKWADVYARQREEVLAELKRRGDNDMRLGLLEHVASTRPGGDGGAGVKAQEEAAKAEERRQAELRGLSERYSAGVKYQKLIGDIAEAETRGYLSAEEASTARARAHGEYADAIEKERRAVLELANTYQSGLRLGLAEWADKAKEVGREVASAVAGAFDKSEDALVQFVTTGKASFGDLANSIIADLVRIAVRQSILGPAADWLGGLFGGGSAVLAGGLPLGMGGIGHNAAGTDYWRGGATWVGERGPEIVNLPRGSSVIPNDRALAAAAGGGRMLIEQHFTISGTGDADLIAKVRGAAAEGARATAQAEVRQFSENVLPTRVHAITSDPRKR